MLNVGRWYRFAFLFLEDFLAGSLVLTKTLILISLATQTTPVLSVYDKRFVWYLTSDTASGLCEVDAFVLAE